MKGANLDRENPLRLVSAYGYGCPPRSLSDVLIRTPEAPISIPLAQVYQNRGQGVYLRAIIVIIISRAHAPKLKADPVDENCN